MRFQNVSYCVFNGFVLDAASHSNILLELDDAMGPVSNITISNCAFRNAAFGATIRAVVNCVFEDNVIFNCSAFGLYADGYASGVSTGNKIWNNTIVSCPSGANIGAGDVTTEYRNNIFYGSTTAIAGGNAGTVTRSNNMFWPASSAPSPLGTNETAQNPLLGSFLELLAGSPAIGAGINVGLPFSGTAPDLGAFQSAASPPAGGTVTGNVTSGGSPLQGALVGVGAYGTAVTDVNGNYTLSATSGTQNVTAWKPAVGNPGYGAVTQPATIPANGTVTLNFVLTSNPGNTWYVSTTGSDTNNGLSTATAWADLTPAASSTTPVHGGDTVKVLGGSYTYAAQINLGYVSGSANFPITYEAVDPNTLQPSPGAATIHFTTAGNSGISINATSYVNIYGFTDIGPAEVSGDNDYALLLQNSNYCTVQYLQLLVDRLELGGRCLQSG